MNQYVKDAIVAKMKKKYVLKNPGVPDKVETQLTNINILDNSSHHVIKSSFID